MRPIHFSSRLPVFGLALLLGVLLGGCAGPEKPKPKDLGAITPLLDITSAWKSGVGRVTFPLQLASIGSTLFLASSEGVVAAIDARTGGDVWRVALKFELSAGVGSDGRHVAVVSKENELVVLAEGKVLWQQKMSAVTHTAPLVAGSRVFILSADRTVLAFDAATGKRLWLQQRAGDALVLGQAGVLGAVNDTLVVGLGGHLVGLNPLTGQTKWDATVATSRGTNEVERLVDLVAGTSRVGDHVCVRAFQSNVGCVDAGRGITKWSKPAIGAVGVHGDDAMVIGTEADGRIVAWNRSDGERVWTSEALRYRTLGAPLVVGRSVVFGDHTGTVHVLSKTNGEFLNRLATDGSPIVAAPTLVGETLVVVTQRGGVFAFRPE
jgi:outer membrane assembly lipoprotein YfgL